MAMTLLTFLHPNDRKFVEINPLEETTDILPLGCNLIQTIAVLF